MWDAKKHSHNTIVFSAGEHQAWALPISCCRIPLTSVLSTSPLGKVAESSDKFAPIIGFWVQGLDKKNFLRLRRLGERKFQGKKPQSALHLF
jgi:hypothetical protein